MSGNNCLICGKPTQVIDTERIEAGTYRRRKCPANHRHSTIEVERDHYNALAMIAAERGVAKLRKDAVRVYDSAVSLLALLDSAEGEEDDD